MPCKKTGLKSQSSSTYLVPRLHRLLVIAESTDALLGNLFELEDLGANEPVGAWAAVRQSYDGCPSAASHRRGPPRRPTPASSFATTNGHASRSYSHSSFAGVPLAQK